VTSLARRLAAPPPGWTRTADVVVVGSGVAGLSVALRLRRQSGARVLLVTKTVVDDGSTRWAQGGIAAALGSADTPAAHLADTLDAGVGLCSTEAVEVLVTEGPQRVRELAALGASFDESYAGGSASPEGFALTREGGHHADRIVHSGGDATGAEVQRALVAADNADPGIELVEGALVVDLLQAADGAVCGVTLHVLGEGTRDGVGAVLARAVVLATGGLGQVFSSTTNPAVSTGDGVACALRAGAEVADLEFVQFHPTALWLGPEARGQQPLISEAVRGEGAVLVDADGHRVMTGLHPLADLAPRDVVAKAMSRRMLELGADHLFLDATGIGAATLQRRFPTIVARCREAGVDPVTQPIPVTPAAHYASGGVLTDLHGRSSVSGLYACGEVACTGVHGANRLASNSLLEGLVFAARIADVLSAGLPRQAEPVPGQGPVGLLDPTARDDVERTMTEGAGVLRSRPSMEGTAKTLAVLAERAARTDPSPGCWETTDLHTVATALVCAAQLREETRGSHWREDFPEAAPGWQGHLVSRLDADGVLHTTYRPS
jgi:L-aspartate oxidase